MARTLQDEGVAVEDIGLRRPSLDDVFLRLTGHRTSVQPARNAENEKEKKTKEAVAA